MFSGRSSAIYRTELKERIMSYLFVKSCILTSTQLYGMHGTSVNTPSISHRYEPLNYIYRVVTSQTADFCGLNDRNPTLVVSTVKRVNLSVRLPIVHALLSHLFQYLSLFARHIFFLFKCLTGKGKLCGSYQIANFISRS